MSTKTEEQAHYRIVRLQAENIKRLEAVDITPTGDVVIVAGNNGEGKTSVLDSLMYAFAGKKAVAAEPIRKGSRKARVEVDCGDFVSIREIDAKGQRLILRKKDGSKIDQPQTFLDELLGRLTFDPLEFSQMKAPDRLTMLLSLTDGLEEKLGEIAAHRSRLYEERTQVNTTVRNAKGQLADMETPKDDWPSKGINTDDIFLKQREARRQLEKNNETRRDLTLLQTECSDLENQIKELEADLEQTKETLQRRVVATTNCQGIVEIMKDPDLDAIDRELAEAIELNKLVDNRRRYDMAHKQMEHHEGEALALTTQITKCDDENAGLLASATLPIEGLAFADGDVLYNDCLFDQLSSAEQLRVSLAMAMAVNPSLRVIRITNGSLLDEDNMQIVRDMAAEHGYQVWIECVGEREDATVIIEDGKVKGD